MNAHSLIHEAFDKGCGVLRMIPNFIPRFCGKAGHRLRLHPDDYFALGVRRGEIKERWFSSVIAASNGPLAAPDEGMSYVEGASGKPGNKFTFKEAVDELGKSLIGSALWNQYGTWPMYAKFFDFVTPLFHHLHLGQQAAELVGRLGKPEGYYFPPQMNNYLGQFPVTYFGFDPDISKSQVRERLLQFEGTDNRITELSRAYRIQLGTGWYTPPGVVHAPGSVLTYEPQWISDVNSVYENVVCGETFPYEFLSENCPEDRKRNIEYIMSLMDWEKNVDPHYRKNYFLPPMTCEHSNEQFTEKWVVYRNEYIAAKELAICPGHTVVVKDSAAFGCIIIQGHGKFGAYDAEAAMMLRYGQGSADEYFVGEQAAKDGIMISNRSICEPMVILKHFGPNYHM